MRLKLAAALTAFLATPLGAQIAGASASDAPLTSRALNATYVESRVRSDPVFADWLRGPSGNAKIAAFLDDPTPHAGSKYFVPTQKQLSDLQAIVAKTSRAAKPAADISAAGGGGSVASTFAGLPSEATLIAGVSSFVVQRARDELVVTMINQSNKLFASDTLLGGLFPNIKRTLASVSESDVSGAVVLLRSASQQDLATLPGRLASGSFGVSVPCSLPVVPKLDKKAPKRDTVAVEAAKADSAKIAEACHLVSSVAADGLRAVGMVASKVAGGETAISALAAFANVADTTYHSPDVARALRLTGVVAREAMSTSLQRSDGFADPTDAPYATAFLLDDVLQLSSKATVSSSEADGARKFIADAGAVDRVVGIARQLQDEVTAASTAAKSAASPTAKAALAEHAVRLIRLSGQLIPDADAAISLATGRSSDFGTTFSNAISRGTDLAAALAGRDYHSGLVALLAIIDTSKWNPKALRWVGFAVTIASADSAVDVAAALDAYALPVNSFIAKRTVAKGEQSSFALLLNAYLGVSGGSEEVSKAAGGAGGYLGATLPIGPEFAFAYAGGCAFSIFIPVVDLGAVASYRLGGSNSVTAPNVGLSQVIAPGLFFIVPVSKDWPLAFGFGAQFAPRLRSVADTTTRSDAVRLGAFFAIDVPLFRAR